MLQGGTRLTLPPMTVAGTDTAGAVVGRSASLELFFDFSFGSNLTRAVPSFRTVVDRHPQGFLV